VEYGQAMDSLSQTFEQEHWPVTFLEQLKNLRDLQLKIQELQVHNIHFLFAVSFLILADAWKEFSSNSNPLICATEY
jgi:hypothetical protein